MTAVAEPVEADENPDAPPHVSARSARWIWPLLIFVVVGSLGLVAVLVETIAEGGRLHFDDVLLLALRRPGHPDQPVGPP